MHTVSGKKIYYGTYWWARKCGFGPEKARTLARYCNALDDDYPSTKYTSASIVNNLARENKIPPPYSVTELKKFKKWQYYHFNGNESGRDSRTNFAISRRNWAVDAWKSGQKDKALQYLGYGLHAVQDYYAHGQIGRGLSVPQHVVYGPGNSNLLDTADDIEYVWKKGSGMTKLEKREKGNSRTRLNDTMDATIKYLNQFIKRIGGKSKVK